MGGLASEFVGGLARKLVGEANCGDESQAFNQETAQQERNARGSLADPRGLSSFMGSLQSRRPWSYKYWIAPHGTEGRVEWDGQAMKRGEMGGVRLVDSVAGESWPVMLVIVIS